MSILKKIVGAAKGAIGGFLTGGPAGAVRGGVIGAIGSGGGGRMLPPPPGGRGTWTGPPTSRVGRVLPGAGSIIGGVAGYMTGRAAAGGNGYPRRRSTRGFSGRDVRQAKRLMKMLKEVSASAPKPRMVRVGKSCD